MICMPTIMGLSLLLPAARAAAWAETHARLLNRIFKDGRDR